MNLLLQGYIVFYTECKKVKWNIHIACHYFKGRLPKLAFSSKNNQWAIELVSSRVSPHHLSEPPRPSTALQPAWWRSYPDGCCFDSCDERVIPTSISFPTGWFKLQYSRWCRGFLRRDPSVWEFWEYDSHLFHQSLLLWEASSRKSRGKLASVCWNLHSGRPVAFL